MPSPPSLDNSSDVQPPIVDSEMLPKEDDHVPHFSLSDPSNALSFLSHSHIPNFPLTGINLEPSTTRQNRKSLNKISSFLKSLKPYNVYYFDAPLYLYLNDPKIMPGFPTSKINPNPNPVGPIQSFEPLPLPSTATPDDVATASSQEVSNQTSGSEIGSPGSTSGSQIGSLGSIRSDDFPLAAAQQVGVTVTELPGSNPSTNSDASLILSPNVNEQLADYFKG